MLLLRGPDQQYLCSAYIDVDAYQLRSVENKNELGSHVHSHEIEAFHDPEIEAKISLWPVISVEPPAVVNVESPAVVSVGAESGGVTEFIHGGPLDEDTTLSFEFAPDIVIPLPEESSSSSPVSVPEPSGLLAIALGGWGLMRSQLKRQGLDPKQLF